MNCTDSISLLWIIMHRWIWSLVIRRMKGFFSLFFWCQQRGSLPRWRSPNNPQRGKLSLPRWWRCPNFTRGGSVFLGSSWTFLWRRLQTIFFEFFFSATVFFVFFCLSRVLSWLWHWCFYHFCLSTYFLPQIWDFLFPDSTFKSHVYFLEFYCH